MGYALQQKLERKGFQQGLTSSCLTQLNQALAYELCLNST